MIRFCDKNVYTIRENEMTRSQMLLFFLSENGAHRRDVLAVVKEDGSYYGIITYQRALEYQDVKGCILKEAVTADENLFEEAGKWFSKHLKELLPILSADRQLCGFCYNDDNFVYERAFKWISDFELAGEIPCSFFEWQKNCKQICIIDCNELAYRGYCFFKQQGYPVRVEGEEWEWFGVLQEKGLALRNETFYIYAEGSSCVRWNWTFEEAPPYVDSFGFIWDWILWIKRYIYKQWAKQIKEMGVSIACCVIPEAGEVVYLTESEMRARYYQVDFTKERFSKKISKEKRAILNEIMGADEVEMVIDKKMVTEEGGYKNITYTDIPCEILKEEREREGRIYLIGPCIVTGHGNFTANTLPACLQEKVEKWDYLVVRMVFADWNWAFMSREEMKKLPLREKDIVLFIDETQCLEGLEGCFQLEFLSIYNNEKRKTWMIDESPMHLNKEGIATVAEEIYNKVLEKEIKRIRKDIKSNHFLQKGEILSAALQEKVNQYIEKVRNGTFVRGEGGIGGIVMNCNPFTYGHQYLIEYAASKVDWLYIFVVEEDRSVFPFVLRKQMVEEGTKHLNNVCVVPSGEWVLSYQTFPVYFGKAERQEEKADAEMDLEIFARYIAPPLGITCRFVGEEPTDKITRQYNEQMKKILGEFDICVEEVPRKEIKGNVISASYVRKCMEEEQFEEIENYVPESTMNILRKQK